MMIDDDNDGQIILGDLGGLKLHEICLTGEENPEKTSPRKLFPTGDRTRARYVTGARAAARPTAMDVLNYSSSNVAKVSSAIAAHAVSISSRSAASVVGFLQYTTFSRVPQR